MIPCIRDDVEVGAAEGGGLVVVDGVAGRRFVLGAEGAAVWRALADGHREPAALCAAVPRMPPARVFGVVRRLTWALLLDAPRWRRQAALFRAGSPAADEAAPRRPRLILHPDLRHRCVGCGSSCHTVDIGPVGPATVAAVRDLELWRVVPGARSADDAFVEGEVGGVALRCMARTAGRCAMLRPDGLCRVHAEAGPASKPGVCRQFPYTFARGPDGVYVGLQVECRRLAPSLAAAADEAAGVLEGELAALLPEASVFSLPDPVPVGPGLFVPWADWRVAWEGVCAEAGDVAAVAGRLLALAADRRDAVAADEPWMRPSAWGLPEPGPASRAALLETLGEAAARVHEGALERDAFMEAGLAAITGQALQMLAGDLALPPTCWAGREAERLLRTAFLAELHGQALLHHGDVLTGLGHLRLRLALADCAARIRACQAARVVVTVQDATDGLVAVNKVLRTPEAKAALARLGGALRWHFAADGATAARWIA